MGVGIFSDCVFFLKVTSLPFKEKTNLKTCITSNGGVISFVVNEKCTHAVVVSNAALNSSQQKNIQKHCIPIVKPDFIWRSIQENRLVEVGLSDSRELEVNLEQVKDDKKSKFLAKFMKHTKTDIAERDFIDDEEFEEQGDEKDFPYDAEVAKYSLFQKGEEIAIVELLCFCEKCPFPFKVSTVCGIPGTSQKEFSFNLASSSEKACNKYEQRMKDLKNKGFTQVNKIRPEAEFLASQALQKVLLGEALNVTQLSPEVGGFVESIWTEAQGHLSSILSCPVKNISLNDVSKAEGILQNVRNALNKGEDARKLMKEFYQCIPHRYRMQENVDKKFLAAKQDLCQLIRDMVNISETNSSGSLPSTVGKYRALKCRVEYVDPNTEEFHRVKKEVLDNNHSNEEFQILRVLRVGRLTEATNFENDLGNVKSLLHASLPSNIVGILSRGLLLPKIVVDEFGLERTDIGNLGSGIYFSDSVSTSVKYTEAFKFSGERMLLVCDVALGKTKDVDKRDYSITEPPEGFHSLHGVRSDVWKNSQFIDDEYVVYDVNQVKMRYVVQFCTSKDTPNLRSEPAVTLLEENEQMTSCELTEDDPLEALPETPNVPKGGLQGMDGQQIPLESIHVKARIKDLAAQVVIFQTYKNNAFFPIEAKYVFPLDSTAAVCGFEAFINGKHIVGEVKEKQQAHQEYRTAISQGHGAYLMDQDAPDVFTVSVGNLPVKATVIIKITYVTELKCSYTTVEFSIPGTVASWQEDQALKENTQDTVAKVGIEGDKATQGNFHLDVSVEMPRKIESMWCSTHSIKKKQTECKAVIQVKEGSSLTDEGFCLEIRLEDAYIPRMWVETHPDQDSEACMLIFEPQFEEPYEVPKVTIFLDCSNSMESCFHSAKLVALLALKTLYVTGINIVTFGSTYNEFYLYPKQTNDLSEMEKFIKMAKPNMGSTEFWKPLQSTCLLRPSSGHHKILLISDGHLQNDNLVFQILKKNKNHIKLFTCGVGAKANKHMLRCLAKNGAGAFEYFADKSKSSWRSQMDKHDSRLKSAACTAVSIKWSLFGRNPAEPMQAPTNIQTLFDNDRIIVYGFVPHCTQATLKALINNKEFENMVATTELQKTTGTILHKLTARAFIQDYEDGILNEKEHENEMEKQKMKSFIIKLSKEHSIVTQFTSFIAVEKRSAVESENVEPNSLEIMSAEDVDILSYMEYADEEEHGILYSWSGGAIEGDRELDGCMGFIFLEGSAEDSKADSVSRSSSPVEERFAGEDFAYLSSSAVQEIFPSEECAYRASPPVQGRSRIFQQLLAVDATPVSSTDLESTDRSQEISVPFTGLHHNLIAESRLTSTNTRQPAFGTPVPHAVGFKMSLHEPTAAGSSLFGNMEAPPPRTSLSGGIFGQSECLDLSQMTQRFRGTSSSAVFGTSGFGAASLPIVPLPLPGLSLSGHSGRTSLPLKASMLSDWSAQPAEEFLGSVGSVQTASRELLESTEEKQHDDMSQMTQRFQATSSSAVFGTSGFGAASLPTVPLSFLRRSLSGHRGRTSLPLNGSMLSDWSGQPAKKCPGSVQPPSRELLESTEEKRYDDSVLSMDSLQYVPTSCSRISSSYARTSPSYAPTSPSYVKSNKETITQFRPIQQQAERYMRQAESTQRDPVAAAAVIQFAPPPPCPPLPCPPPPCPPRLCHPLLCPPPPSSPLGAPPPPCPPWLSLDLAPGGVSLQMEHKRTVKMKKEKKTMRMRSILVDLSWSSFSPLQSQEGYWMLTPTLGELLKIDVKYFCDTFLTGKGISSLGLRGKDEVLKLIATLLVLQRIRTYHLLSGIKFKTLMKLDQCDSESESYPAIEKAINWAVKTDKQYSGICSRLGLGRDWDHATRQLLGIESPSSDLSLALFH